MSARTLVLARSEASDWARRVGRATLMSPVKPKTRGYPAPTRTLREVVVLMDRAEERAGAQDVGEQALMRGLDTAFPLFVWGCPGLASGVDQTIGHIMAFGNSPAV